MKRIHICGIPRVKTTVHPATAFHVCYGKSGKRDQSCSPSASNRFTSVSNFSWMLWRQSAACQIRNDRYQGQTSEPCNDHVVLTSSILLATYNIDFLTRFCHQHLYIWSTTSQHSNISHLARTCRPTRNLTLKTWNSGGKRKTCVQIFHIYANVDDLDRPGWEYLCFPSEDGLLSAEPWKVILLRISWKQPLKLELTCMYATSAS